MNYRASKMIGRRADNQANAAEMNAIDDGHPEHVATAVSNAVHDAIIQDEQVATFVEALVEVEQVTDDRELDTTVGSEAFGAVERLRNALNARLGEVATEAIADGIAFAAEVEAVNA